MNSIAFPFVFVPLEPPYCSSIAVVLSYNFTYPAASFVIVRSSVIVVSKTDCAYWVFWILTNILEAELKALAAIAIRMLIRNNVTIVSTSVVPFRSFTRFFAYDNCSFLFPACLLSVNITNCHHPLVLYVPVHHSVMRLHPDFHKGRMWLSVLFLLNPYKSQSFYSNPSLPKTHDFL